MRRHRVFWPAVLIILGVLLLLDNLNVFAPLRVNVWSIFWPLLLVLLGLWILWGATGRRGHIETEQAAIPIANAAPREGALEAEQAAAQREGALETEQAAVPQEAGAARAHIRVHHGAGRLHLGAGAAPGNLVDGSFGGGLEVERRQVGDAIELDLRPRFRAWRGPWGPHNALDWDLRLTGDLPIALEMEMGASESRLDLTNLRVTDLKVETGASATHLTLPANAGQTRVQVQAGAAAVNIYVPAGVAARIRSSNALADTDVDALRFPRQGDVYQSVNYDTAENRVDIDIQAALGAVEIR